VSRNQVNDVRNAGGCIFLSAPIRLRTIPWRDLEEKNRQARRTAVKLISADIRRRNELAAPPRTHFLQFSPDTDVRRLLTRMIHSIIERGASQGSL